MDIKALERLWGDRKSTQFNNGKKKKNTDTIIKIILRCANPGGLQNE